MNFLRKHMFDIFLVLLILILLVAVAAGLIKRFG